MRKAEFKRMRGVKKRLRSRSATAEKDILHQH